MTSVPNDQPKRRRRARPASESAVAPPVDALKRGWENYAATIVAPTVADEARLLVRLGYYAGAAYALGLLTPENADDWPAVVAAAAREVADATDRLLLAALLGRPLE